MNIQHRIVFISTTLLLCTCGAYTQQATQGGAGVAGSMVQPTRRGALTTTIGMSAPPLHGNLITGAPYSAEQIYDHIQTLADGTHITQKTRITKFYRDSEGRTRTDRPMFMNTRDPSEDVTIIEIADPVSGFRYVLDPYNHIAHRFAPPEKPGEPVRYSQQAIAASPRTTASTPARAVLSAAPTHVNRPDVTTESLGTQIIEGVSAEGTKMTGTLPVGAIGNDRPIVSVTESWFSPDLKVDVLSKTSDPRMGESTMKLQNIDRSEPDLLLFRVPPDYQIVDESSDRVEIKITRP